MFGTPRYCSPPRSPAGWALALGFWLPSARWPDILAVLAVAVLSGAAVFLWRLPEPAPTQRLRAARLLGQRLGRPALTYLVSSGYGEMRELADPPRYHQLRALATLDPLAGNVITI
jgi:hypothetical protein